MHREDLGREALCLIGELHRFARWLERSPGAAEDLVQAAFARALERADELEDPAKLKSWLFRLLHHLHVDRRRGEVARARFVVLEGGLDDLEDIALGTLDESLLRREEARALADALRHLSDEQRAALVLIDGWGYSYEEAGQIVDVPAGTIRSRVTRARARVEVLLGDELPAKEKRR